MKHWVIVWDNDGNRTSHEVGSYLSAVDVARAARTIHNRTVKIADAHSSVSHWGRSMLKTRPNHWTRRAVADGIA